jgi:hypothetical protein
VTPRWREWALRLLPVVVLVLIGLATPTKELYPHQGDVGLYLEKAAAVAAGQFPYRDVPLEYPPLALVAMVVPYLAWPFGPVSLDVYKWLFLGWECVLLVVLGMIMGRLAEMGAMADPDADDDHRTAAARRRRMARRVALLVVASPLVLAWRFDLYPALLTAIAVWAALDDRPATAGLALGMGVLAKAYPLILVPAIAARWLLPLDLRRVVRFGAGLTVTLAVVMLPFALLGGDEVWRFLAYQAGRGLQIESIGGGLVMLDGLVRGVPVTLDFGFSAVQVTGALANTWLAILPWLIAAAFGLLAVVGWLRARAEVASVGRLTVPTAARLAAAAILVLLVTNKVFSVQYVVWLLPFAALLPRGQLLLAAAIGLLSAGVHPLTYLDLVAGQSGAVLLLNLRNALMLGLAAWVVADLRGRLTARAAVPAARVAAG